MGSKGSSTPQTTTTSSSPPPQVLAEYQGLVDRATNVANQPYQAYQGEQVAPLSYQTQTGLGGINQYANAAQPGYSAAMAGTAAAATPVSPTSYSGQALGQFMNPYTQSVTNATQAEFANQNQQQAQMLNSNAIGAGAYGGDRAGVAQSILANQQQTAQAPVIAGLNQANFTNAQNEFNTQQQTGLQAQEYNAGQLGAMANQYGALAGQAQQAGLQGSQAQIQAGMIPQQEQQAIDTAMQNNYLQQQSYPFQTTGWLGNLIEGTGSASGGTGTTSSPGPSTTSQAVGGITSGLGILGSLMSLSDERSKDDVRPIGKTFDGQTIYRFRFKGDPRTQIGLLAHETEKKHPRAVGHFASGLKGVDYDEATDSAADRGHFTYGGMVRPGYDVGGMTPEFLGQNGAIGVYTPGYNPTSGSGEELGSLAGVNEALAGAESAGQKNPYTGIDFDQIEAISSGQWMPPQTNSPLPNYTNPGSSPQTSGAEASLAGLIARPGIETNMGTSTTPSASPAATAAATPTPTATPQRGNVSVNGGSQWFSPSSPQAAAINAGMYLAHGGRAGFASGGGPDFTTVQYNTDRERGSSAPIYTALDLSGKGSSTPVPTSAPLPEHPVVTIARHIARQANARAQAQPQQQVVKRDGTTGQPVAYEPGGGIMPPDSWPTGPHNLGNGVDPSSTPIDSTGPTVRFGAKMPFRPVTPTPEAPTPGVDPTGWSVGENPPGSPRATPPTPEYLTPSTPSIGGVLRGAGRVLGGPWGNAAGQILQSSPAETGTLAPKYWPPGAVGAPSRPVTLNPRGNVIALPNPNGSAATHNWGPWHSGGTPTGPIIDPPGQDTTGELNWGDEGPVNYARGGRAFRAAGGQLGQSGFAAALEQPPQGANVSGDGQGGFATANQAAGFSGLYGSGRSGFAAGGDPSALAPYAGVGGVSWVPAPSTGMMGKGPPQPPQVPSQGSGAAASTNQGADLSKAVEKLGQQWKTKGTATPGTQSPGASPPTISMPTSGTDSGIGGDADLSGAAGTADFSSLAPDTFSDTSGDGLGGGFDNFARGGRLARAAGGDANLESEIDANFSDGSTPTPAPAATAAGAIAAQGPPVSGNVGQGLSNNRAETSPAQRAQFYRQYIAQKYPGADPNIALGVAGAEGLNTRGVGASTVDVDPRTGQPFSFGDFQMNIHPGALGDQARQAGADPTDPNQWKQVGQFAIDKMYGGKGGVNLGPWQGDAYAKQYIAGNTPAGRPALSSQPSGGGAIPGGSIGPDGMPSPMAVPQGYFQPHDYSDPNSSKRELFGAMMAAGFGMMAGTSPYAAVNIGQGGLAGVNYLQKQQELDRNWMLDQSKIDQMSAQERRADADVGLRVNQFNFELAKYKAVMQTNQNVANILTGGSGGVGAGGGGSSAAPIAASPSASPSADTPGTIGPHGVAPSNMGDVGIGNQLIGKGIVPTTGPAPTPAYGGPGDATPKIAPAGAPAPAIAQGGPGSPAGKLPVSGAPIPAAGARAAPVASSGAASAAAAPAEPPTTASPTTAAANPSSPPGAPGPNDPFWKGKMQNPYNYMRAGMALASSPDPQQQARGQELIKQAQEIWSSGMVDGQPIPGIQDVKAIQAVQPEAAKALWSEQAKMSDQYDDRQVARQRLNDIQDIMQSLQTGAWATDKADIQSKLRSLGVDVPDSATWNAGAVQRFSKNATANVFAQLKDVGGRPMVAEIRGLQESNANPDLTPEANARIVTQGLGILDREDAHYQDYTTWHHQNPAAYDTSEFEKSWKQANPLEKFVNAQMKHFGYQGQYLPMDPSNRVEGQTYMTPKGPRVWSAQNGWAKPSAAAAP
jgi:hypothetical protein